MSIPKEKIFHIGLCMAGSVTAGAYTAGVLDYLIEALENWEELRGKDLSLPDHHVVIDLLSGTSGGGMNAAMASFAMRDKLEHGELRVESGRNIFKPTINNILWKCWVDMRDTPQTPLFPRMLDTVDIDRQDYVSSALNSTFIDEISQDFADYITSLAKGPNHQPAYLCPENELCMMIFNVTGIRYRLTTHAVSKVQYAMHHRDLGHFRWQKAYNEDPAERDGRIEIHFDNLSRLNILIDAAKATGAFPAGLKPRLLSRPAKYVWDHPFFRKGTRFDRNSIYLGENVCGRDDMYTSINADGGTANNEPVELCRELLYEMRLRYYKDLVEPSGEDETITRREEVLQTLTNSTVILIDPFPSVSGRVDKPVTGQGSKNTDNITGYAGKMIDAMRSTLLTDAKLTMEAYQKENYGLYLIAPSRNGTDAAYTIACGSLDGFGGFLNKEFRIHDFFLGRHNCQSFLRQYFVVDLNEPHDDDRKCIQAVINAYEQNPAAKARFQFRDKAGKWWAPIIPDVTLKEPFNVHQPQNQLPEYILNPLAANALDYLQPHIKRRVKAVIDNVINGGGVIKFLAKLFSAGSVSSTIMDKITDDLKSRKLMTGKMKNPADSKPPQKECPQVPTNQA